MYAVFAKMETKGHFVGRERKFDTSSVAAAYDRLHLAKLKGQEGAPAGAVGLVLMNTDTGKVLRTHMFPVAQLPALKLSDAMTRALSTTTKDGYVTGAANTLKALANKGLLQANGAKYQITNLGRQYQKKGA